MDLIPVFPEATHPLFSTIFTKGEKLASMEDKTLKHFYKEPTFNGRTLSHMVQILFFASDLKRQGRQNET